MSIRRVYAPALLAAALLGLGCGLAPESGEPPEPASPAEQPEAPPAPASLAEIFPPSPARALVLDSCGVCHAAACSAIGQRTQARWGGLQQGHRDKVADMSDEDFEALFAYLRENFNDAQPEPNVPPQFLEGGCTPF